MPRGSARARARRLSNSTWGLAAYVPVDILPWIGASSSMGYLEGEGPLAIFGKRGGFGIGEREAHGPAPGKLGIEERDGPFRRSFFGVCAPRANHPLLQAVLIFRGEEFCIVQAFRPLRGGWGSEVVGGQREIRQVLLWQVARLLVGPSGTRSFATWAFVEYPRVGTRHAAYNVPKVDRLAICAELPERTREPSCARATPHPPHPSHAPLQVTFKCVLALDALPLHTYPRKIA